MKEIVLAAKENPAHDKIQKGFGQKLCKKLSRHKYLYFMAIPVILYYLIFCYLPMGGVVIAFKQYEIAKGILASEWVGLKFFKEFFSGIYFWRILKNTLLISFYDLLFSFPITIGFALLLNEIKSLRFKKIVQSVTYLPHFISMVVLCGNAFGVGKGFYVENDTVKFGPSESAYKDWITLMNRWYTATVNKFSECDTLEFRQLCQFVFTAYMILLGNIFDFCVCRSEYQPSGGQRKAFLYVCLLLKKIIPKKSFKCLLLKKKNAQKNFECLLLKKQIKKIYFLCLLFLTGTKILTIRTNNYAINKRKGANN